MVRIEELKKIDLFSSFSEKHLEEIAHIAGMRTYRSNTRIYSQGDVAKDIFVVVKGLVSLRGYKSEDELVIAFELCEPGDLFGAASMMREQHYTLTALAMENTDVLVINSQMLTNLCEADFELGYRLMRKIAQLYFNRYEVLKRELGVPVQTRKQSPF